VSTSAGGSWSNMLDVCSEELMRGVRHGVMVEHAGCMVGGAHA
jgi:hypothetical protein